MPRADASSRSPSDSARTPAYTRWPIRAKCTAHASPMPVDAPVTRIVFIPTACREADDDGAVSSLNPIDRVLGAVVPRAVGAVDLDELLETIDLDELLDRIDVDSIIKRVDI